MPVWLEVSSSALRKAASPPNSTWTPDTSDPATASERTANAGFPISRSGASRVSSAKPIRPSSETVPASNGSATDSTWSNVATSVSTEAIASR